MRTFDRAYFAPRHPVLDPIAKTKIQQARLQEREQRARAARRRRRDAFTVLPGFGDLLQWNFVSIAGGKVFRRRTVTESRLHAVGCETAMASANRRARPDGCFQAIPKRQRRAAHQEAEPDSRDTRPATPVLPSAEPRGQGVSEER